MFTQTRLLGVVVGLLFLATSARAAPETTNQLVERLGNEAINAYRLGKYDRAVELLNRAYAIQPLAALLFNLAKAHDKLEDPVKAYETYKKYLASGEADPKLVPKAQARIEALEVAYRAKTAPPPKEPPKEAGPSKEDVVKAKAQGKAEAEQAAAEKAAADQEAQRRAADGSRDSRRTTLMATGVVVAVLGAGGIGAGVGLWSSVASKQTAFGNSTDEAVKRSLRDSAGPLASASTAMYVVGGALAAVGLAVLVVGVVTGKKKSEAPAVTAAPWVSPTGAGAVATWRF